MTGIAQYHKPLAGLVEEELEPIILIPTVQYIQTGFKNLQIVHTVLTNRDRS